MNFITILLLLRIPEIPSTVAGHAPKTPAPTQQIPHEKERQHPVLYLLVWVVDNPAHSKIQLPKWLLGRPGLTEDVHKEDPGG